MKIGFLVWEYPPSLVGGLGTYAQNMAPRLVKAGHDVVVFTLNRGDLPVREVMEGVEVHRPLLTDGSKALSLVLSEHFKQWGAGAKFFTDVLLYNIHSAAELLNGLVKGEGYNFDIISFHDWLSSLGGLIVRDSSKLPCAFHIHSTEWGRTRGRASEVVLAIESSAAEQAERIITVSNVMKEDLINHRWPGEKIEVVWNGVDPRRYAPERVPPESIRALRAKYKIGDDEAMVLFVGRLTHVKGVHNLIAAMPMILRDHPRTKLVVLGQGELEWDLMGLVKSMNLPDAVKLRFEFVPEEDRILHYAASDICAFPSTYEPFGIVSLEAMAMAKPVVVGASGIVGFREQVLPNGPDQCGIHIDGADPRDIAWGLSEALKDPQRAKAWGANGRKRVKEFFTWDRAVAETIGIYEKTISQGSS